MSVCTLIYVFRWEIYRLYSKLGGPLGLLLATNYVFVGIFLFN